MRRFASLLVLFLVTISTATGVHASTECEKWLTEYRNSLAHSPAVHQIRTAHRRLHRYIHRKLNVLKKPAAPKKKPRVLPARHTRPKMSREELLKKIELACGDLPIDIPQPEVADVIPQIPDDSEVELASDDGGPFIPTFAPPVYPGGVPMSPDSGSPGSPFTPPILGSGPKPQTPTTTGTTTSCSTNPTAPGCDSGGNTPPLVTPEPGTMVLILTGIPGVAEMVRRRRRRA